MEKMFPTAKDKLMYPIASREFEKLKSHMKDDDFNFHRTFYMNKADVGGSEKKYLKNKEKFAEEAKALIGHFNRICYGSDKWTFHDVVCETENGVAVIEKPYETKLYDDYPDSRRVPKFYEDEPIYHDTFTYAGEINSLYSGGIYDHIKGDINIPFSDIRHWMISAVDYGYQKIRLVTRDEMIKTFVQYNNIIPGNKISVIYQKTNYVKFNEIYYIVLGILKPDPSKSSGVDAFLDSIEAYEKINNFEDDEEE